jgi:predicted amidophosphoribosyltransferase
VKYCKACRKFYGEDTCPRCGTPEESEAADNMDELVQAASVPSLASLFKKAKKAGVIDAVQNYGEGAVGPSIA